MKYYLEKSLDVYFEIKLEYIHLPAIYEQVDRPNHYSVFFHFVIFY